MRSMLGPQRADIAQTAVTIIANTTHTIDDKQELILLVFHAQSTKSVPPSPTQRWGCRGRPLSSPERSARPRDGPEATSPFRRRTPRVFPVDSRPGECSK